MLTLFFAVVWSLLWSAAVSLQDSSLRRVWHRSNSSLPIHWQCIDSDATGQHLIAGSLRGDNLDSSVFLSDDFGITWTRSGGMAEQKAYYMVSIDPTANYYKTAQEGAWLMQSINHGADWVKYGNDILGWVAIHHSTQLMAAATIRGGYMSGWIYRSYDKGNTWSKLNFSPNLWWTGLSGSNDGWILIGITRPATVNRAETGGIYVSTDRGENWTKTSAPDIFYSSIVADTRGERIVVAAREAYATGPGLIYVSSNSGATWTKSTAEFPHIITGLAGDQTGQFLAATTDGGGIYLSSDFGMLWELSAAPIQAWREITSDVSGNYFVAVADRVGIFTFNRSAVSDVVGPSAAPTLAPTSIALRNPTWAPSPSPTHAPTEHIPDSAHPTSSPTHSPTAAQTALPTSKPTPVSSRTPSSAPTVDPTASPSGAPSEAPSASPSTSPSAGPSPLPSAIPSAILSAIPSAVPSQIPTVSPSFAPTSATRPPSGVPTISPSVRPSGAPSMAPTAKPSATPTHLGTDPPQTSPTRAPSGAPTEQPSIGPTVAATNAPSVPPSLTSTRPPLAVSTAAPTALSTKSTPTCAPTAAPSIAPTPAPTAKPTKEPTALPTAEPSAEPALAPVPPTAAPTVALTLRPSSAPTTPLRSVAPTLLPTPAPSIPGSDVLLPLTPQQLYSLVLLSAGSIFLNGIFVGMLCLCVILRCVRHYAPQQREAYGHHASVGNPMAPTIGRPGAGSYAHVPTQGHALSEDVEEGVELLSFLD